MEQKSWFNYLSARLLRCNVVRYTISGVCTPFFFVAEFAVGWPVARLDPPSFTPFPEADTPTLCIDSLPRVGRNRVEALPSFVASPSAELGMVSRTRNSLELVLGPADMFPFPFPFPFLSEWPFIATDWILEGDITPCNASGTSAEDGGANIDKAPVEAASIVGAKAAVVPLLIALAVSDWARGV